jgi:hypothetical protein
MTATATLLPAPQPEPEQDHPQHLQALEQANRVRLARAELKRRVAKGETRVADVILSCPWEVESMTVFDLLTSQRRWGRTRARKFLSSLPLSETKRIGSLTHRQRVTLAALLTAGGKAPVSSAATPFAFVAVPQ